MHRSILQFAVYDYAIVTLSATHAATVLVVKGGLLEA
jgi:hypothetical protein